MCVTRTMKFATSFLIWRASSSMNLAVSLASTICLFVDFRSCLTRSSLCPRSALCLHKLLGDSICALVTFSKQRCVGPWPPIVVPCVGQTSGQPSSRSHPRQFHERLRRSPRIAAAKGSVRCSYYQCASITWTFSRAFTPRSRAFAAIDPPAGISSTAFDATSSSILAPETTPFR
jgi:hypothetical protein